LPPRGTLFGVRVRLLGPVDVLVDGAPRPVPGPRRKAVLAVLALRRGEVVASDRLADAVWGEAAPPTVVNTLQRHISHLRQVLGDRTAITARPPGYVLAAPTDVEDAERLVRQGIQGTDQHQRVADLRAALALWRGPSLADVTGQPWLDEQAQRLDRLRLQARRALVEARLAVGEHRQLVPELEELTAEHPFEEHLHGQLMLALYRSGRQADALAAYRRLRTRLRDELGIEPSQPLRDLETAILRQDTTLAPGAPGTQRPAQLPAAMAAFAGRDTELAILDATLDESRDTVALATVSGTAGIGKTTLAVQWAHRVAGRFPDGQLYVDLRGFDPGGATLEPAEALRGFLDAFGVPAKRIPADLDQRAASYRSLLAGRRVLVVLDNARDVAQVRPLLPGAAGCMAVVTSRDRLTPLVATAGARPLGLELLTAEEARDLLARRLGPARVAAEPDAVDEVIRYCARLPLALGIAAALAATRPGFPLAALAMQLRAAADRLDAFNGGDPSTDVRVVFSWSYRTLSFGAARLFRLLGLHPGPDVSVPAAASLAGLPPGQALPLLTELAQAHLLTEHAPGRYAFHDLLRAYAAEQAATVDPAAERTAARHRMLDHYLHTAQAATRWLYGPWCQLPLPPAQPGVTPEEPADATAANAWLTAEQNVLLAAAEQSATTGFETHCWQLAFTLTLVLEAYGRWQDYATMQTIALDAANRVGDRAGIAHAHGGLGRAYSWLGQDDEAFDQLRQALDRFKALRDEAGQGNVHLGLGFLYDRKGAADEALRESREALELFRSAGHRSGQATAVNNIGWSLAELGRPAEALWYCEESLRLHGDIGDVQCIAGSFDSLGYVQHRLGDYQRAIVSYSESLARYRQLDDRYNQASTLARLGDTHEAVGDRAAAREVWLRALAILDELGHPDAEEIRFRVRR
jgi:DNA-binding SARP family transcriptional activator/tetratricopeptide (TPR) repeat protein